MKATADPALARTVTLKAYRLGVAPEVATVAVEETTVFTVTKENTDFTLKPLYSGLACSVSGDNIECVGVEVGTFTVTVLPTANATYGKTVTVTVTPRTLALEDSADYDLPTMMVGEAVAPVTVAAATGGVAPYTYSATGLPDGLAFNAATRQITGTPTTVASAGTARVAVTDYAGNSASIEVGYGAVVPALVLADNASYDIPEMVSGEAIAPVTVAAATGGVAPYTYSATGLPDGLDIDYDSGKIRGTPTAAVAAAGTATVSVRDQTGHVASITVDYGAVTLVRMVPVAGGMFTMGCTAEQGSDCAANESPTHSVTLSDFSIGKYEVKQGQWVAVMGSNPSSVGAGSIVSIVSWDEVVGTSGGSCRTTKGVTYYANGFICKLNQLEAAAGTGRVYRLPTEAEWEYAARGGAWSAGYKYSGSNIVGDVAWYSGNGGGVPVGTGAKVGNELGIHDMSGNVYEWVGDRYGNYSNGAQTNPTGPSSGSYRVIRGGSISDPATSMRVSHRGYQAPDDNGSRLVGFRLALDQ
ncbi:MAG: SUMF1/EgtB/PvdO family nonheme iron enzyme [Acidobacteriota bacterium]|nr:SUMF1/EgtB/PvdO family nonheme iron enzyme [Acidobacteriota bacterium]